jgi:hypothetical protein
MIVTGSFAKDLYPGVKKWWGQAYDSYKTEYTELFEHETTSRAFEEYVQFTGLGLAAIKREGAAITYDDMKQGYVTRFVPVNYALGFVVSKEAVADGISGIVGKKRARFLAESFRQTKETVGANVYNRAFNTSYTMPDGQPVCATAHVNYTGGTFANRPTTDADLSEAALEQACIDIAGYTNDRGLKIAVHAQKLCLPYQLEFEAERILGTPYRVGTSDNDVNAIRKLGKFPEGVCLSHWFDDSDAWFIRTSCAKGEGLVYFEREKISFGMDQEFDTSAAKFKAEERYSFGIGDPRAIYGTQGA